MNFDETYDRIASRSAKWTAMQAAFGVTGEDPLPMWIADMDFKAPDFLTKAARDVAEIGDYGYFAHLDSYYEAVCWWAKTRHGWEIDPSWITTTVSLGNAIALAIQAWSKPGDSVAIFTPVYHEFASKIRRNDRQVTELPLIRRDGMFALDFKSYDGLMTGCERMLILSSPHNPGGRVWSAEELRGIADFCQRHDLILISDEVHNDLVLPGFKHLPTAVAVPEISDRLVTMTSASKTFSIAGTRLGAAIIGDKTLRAQFADTVYRADLAPNLLGVAMSRAAFTPEGAAWVDELLVYLAKNVATFSDGVNALPGVSVHPLQGTYLAWADCSGTGLSDEELWKRVTKAGVVPSPGPAFGLGGSQGLRFNLGTQHARVEQAVERLSEAFSDLQ